MADTFPRVSGDVLLVGGYGAGNLGDEAILSGLLADVSTDVGRLSVVSHDPTATERTHRNEVPTDVSFRAIAPAPRALLSALARADAVVVGGGGLFSRYMGPYATKIPAFALAALALGREVHWTAVGVYDSTPSHVLRLLTFAMARSHSVSVRDSASLVALSRRGVPNVRLVPDPALALTPDADAGRALLETAGLDPSRPTIGIAARRLGDDAATKRLFAGYAAVARRFAERGWQVVWLPFCQHPTEPVERDEDVCRALAARLGGTVVAPATAPEMLSVVAALDAVVATRLHSMLFAHVAETPFVAVSYATKVHSLLVEIGHTDREIPLDAVDGPLLLDGLDQLLRSAEGAA